MTDFSYKIVKTSSPIDKLVVFLHGYTSNAEDIMPYAEILAKNLCNTLIVIPEASMTSERKEGKKQWYALLDIDPERRRKQPDTPTEEIVEIYNKAGVRISSVAKKINRFISQFQKKYHISNKHTFVMGFSQGAMLALYTGLTRRYELGGVFPFAGIICGKDLLEKEQVSHPEVYLFHGTDDFAVQYKTLEFTKNWLANHHIAWTALEYEGIAHKLIIDEMLDAAKIINQQN
ncbi:MAG: dienelactone hydrolase family protein [Alphaproteobacteria bacterium]|nr:dienelactone hydrolase family protein [Alphaproteobacteria bacterium]